MCKSRAIRGRVRKAGQGRDCRLGFDRPRSGVVLNLRAAVCCWLPASCGLTPAEECPPVRWVAGCCNVSHGDERSERTRSVKPPSLTLGVRHSPSPQSQCSSSSWLLGLRLGPRLLWSQRTSGSARRSLHDIRAMRCEIWRGQPMGGGNCLENSLRVCACGFDSRSLRRVVVEPATLNNSAPPYACSSVVERRSPKPQTRVRSSPGLRIGSSVARAHGSLPHGRGFESFPMHDTQSRGCLFGR